MEGERLPVVWCQRPDDDNDDVPDDPYIIFRVARPAFWAVDSDQFILPVNILERNGESYDHPRLALLKQYGGSNVAMDMMTAGPQGITAGEKYELGYDDLRGFVVTHIDSPAD